MSISPVKRFFGVLSYKNVIKVKIELKKVIYIYINRIKSSKAAI